MNKKFYIALLLVFLIAIFVFVLYGESDNLEVRKIDKYIETTTEAIDKIDKEGYVNGIYYQVSDVEYYSSYKNRGYFTTASDNKVMYAISSGQKNTGGYSLEVTNIEIDDNKNVIIHVNETIPKKGSMTTMALTCPCIFVDIYTKVNSIKIVNSENKEFSKLN